MRKGSIIAVGMRRATDTTEPRVRLRKFLDEKDLSVRDFLKLLRKEAPGLKYHESSMSRVLSGDFKIPPEHDRLVIEKVTKIPAIVWLTKEMSRHMSGRDV